MNSRRVRLPETVVPCSSLPLLSDVRAARELGETEDDELRRLHRRDPDLADDLPAIDDVRGIRLGVALHVEGLLRSRPEQRAVPPDTQEERVDRALDPLPEVEVVRLEDDPLGALEDRLLDVVEQTANVEVPPRRVAGDGAGAPHADAAARE